MGVYPEKKARFYTYICRNMTHFRQSTQRQLPAYQYAYGNKTASGVCLQNTTDYSPFGVTLDGRTMQGDGYRYGWNTQEKVDEISGLGNHFTAMFWEYDTRLGRRWNLDPIYYTDISRFVVNGNNPIYYLDPNGDFKSKFGANVYKFLHGGTVTQAQSGKHKGEWYVHKRVESGRGAKGRGKLSDGSIELDEVKVIEQVRWDWGKNNLANSLDRAADDVNSSVNFLQKSVSDIWNSPIARSIIPDYYTFSGSFQTNSGVYMNEELTFTLILRGRDPGIYFNTTTGFGGVSSIGVDVGCSIGKGYYLGDARNLSSSLLGGWQGSGGFGVGLKAIAGGSINGGVDVGFSNGKATTVTRKVGISLGVGVSTPVLQGSGGTGIARPAIPLFKF